MLRLYLRNFYMPNQSTKNMINGKKKFDYILQQQYSHLDIVHHRKSLLVHNFVSLFDVHLKDVRNVEHILEISLDYFHIQHDMHP